MKIKSIFKLFATVGITTAAGLSVGLFVDMIPDSYSNVKILTKDVYQKMTGNNPDDKTAKKNNVKIDYSLLPTSQYSFREILDNPKNVNGGNFIFFFGSQAYKTTNTMLWGINDDYILGQGKAQEVNSSIMLRLYDAFFNKETSESLGINKVDPVFLNYVDMVNTKELSDAYNLKRERACSLGNFVTNEKYIDPATGQPGTPPEAEQKNYQKWVNPSNDSDVIWYKIDKFHWSVGGGEDNERDAHPEEVVRGINNAKSPEFTNFNFEPDPTTYYEFRPNSDKDTEYEKVYYRNTREVKNFNMNYAFMESYLSKVYSKSGANKQGMIMCVRNLDPSKYTTKTIDNPFDMMVLSNISTDHNSLNKTFDDIVHFYNPDYIKDSDSSSSESTSSPSTPSEPTTPPAPAPAPAPTSRAKVVHQKDYAINQLSDNVGEMNKNLATIEVKK